MKHSYCYQASYLAAKLIIKNKKAAKRRKSVIAKRTRKSVEDIFQCLGPYHFRRAYRMQYRSFWKLFKKLRPALIKKSLELNQRNHGLDQRKQGPKKQSRHIHNGRITLSVRLAVALRFFAGGSSYDIMCKYGICHADVYNSVSIVIDAINDTDDLKITYPESFNDQIKIANEFEKCSDAKISICAGAHDGMLVWIERPNEKDCKQNKCDPDKFYCGRKKKFGLNLQATCDANLRFLDLSIMYPGSSSDCLAFEGSKLYSNLEHGLLHPSLCIFGDSAYINSNFLTTTYTGLCSGAKDAYNFHHSQLRIKIECAFGVFVQRWGILRTAIRSNMGVKKINAMVLALAKLHNFCIDETLEMSDDCDDNNIVPLPLSSDQVNIEGSVSGYINIDYDVTNQLTGSGDHFDDLPSNYRRDAERRNVSLTQQSELPRDRLLRYISENNYRRPNLRHS